MLLLLLPAFDARSEVPKLEYRFVVLQSTAGTDLVFLGPGALNEAGQAAWLATHSFDLCGVGDCSIFTGDGSAPATTLATTVATNFLVLGDPDINGAGDVVFHGAQLLGPGDMPPAIYLSEPGSGVRRILTAGDVVSDIVVPGLERFVVLNAFDASPKINDNGLILSPLQIFDGNIPNVGGSGFLDRIAIYERSTEEVHWPYEAAMFSDVPADTWDYAEFAWESYFNNNNEILTFGVAQMGDSTSFLIGSWLEGGVASQSPYDPLPLVEVANNTTQLAELYTNPWLNEGGQVLYQAKPNAGDDHDGIFISDDGSVTTVVDPNDTEVSVFESLAVMNGALEVAFEGHITDFPASLFVWNPTAGLRRVFSATSGESPLLDLAGEDLKPGLDLFAFWIYDIDENGNLLLDLIFDDFSEMMVIAQPMPVPEPGSGAVQLAALATLFCLAGWQGQLRPPSPEAG